MNRTYYSVLYGAKALLATKAVDSSKHSGVATLFYREFIEPGIVSRNAGRILNQLLRKRLKGDYTDFYSFPKEEIEKALKEADSFLAEIKRVLNKLIEKGDQI